MRDVDGAIAWMKDQSDRAVRGWKGLCLKACRTSYGLPGGWPDADAFWSDVPPEHRHSWSDNPPRGAAIYWAIGAHGHVAISDGAGRVWGTDLPNTDRIGLASIHDPRVRWGAKPVGWSSWLNGAVLPLEDNGSAPAPPNGKDDEDMDYVEARSGTAGQDLKGGKWQYLQLPVNERNEDGVHYGTGPTFVTSSSRFLFVVTMGVGAPVKVAARAAIMNGETVVDYTGTVESVKENRAPEFVIAGYSPKDRNVRLQLWVPDDVNIRAYVVGMVWR